MEAFIFIFIIFGTSTLLFCLIEGWKRYLDKKHFDEEEKQDKNSTEKTGGANP